MKELFGFVDLEVAKDLKRFGFNGFCTSYFEEKKKKEGEAVIRECSGGTINDGVNIYSRPKINEAIEWIYDKYEIYTLTTYSEEKGKGKWQGIIQNPSIGDKVIINVTEKELEESEENEITTTLLKTIKAFFSILKAKKEVDKFNKEKAMRGDPVETANGQEARIICFDGKMYDGSGPIIALVKEEDTGKEWLMFCNDRGESESGQYNLIMKTPLYLYDPEKIGEDKKKD